MHINSKADFNVCASRFRSNLAISYDFIIKPTKVRELLAKSAGFSSHNNLLSKLPLDAGLWCQKATSSQLNSLIKVFNGREIESLPLLIDAFNTQRSASSSKAEWSHKESEISEYAYIRETNTDSDEDIICLTDLGRKILDEAHQIASDIETKESFQEAVESVEERLREMIEQHPNNPWPKAVYLTTLAPLYFQGGWTDNLGKSMGYGFVPDHDPRFEGYSGRNAEMFIDVALQAISQFKSWVGSRHRRLADHRLMSQNSEPYYYPATLFWGAKVALNSGEIELAKKWLTWHEQIVPGDNFGARYYLSALSLIRGKNSIKQYFKKEEYTEGWGYLCFAAEAYTLDKYDEAREYFLKSIKRNFGSFEAFGGVLPVRDDIAIVCNQSGPAFINELMFITNSFWEEFPGAWEFFSSICAESGVRNAVCNYHLAKSNTVGLAFKGAQEAAAINSACHQTERELERLFTGI